MPMDPPILLAIAVVALFVASTVSQRTGAHADQRAGRRRVAHADRRGLVGPVVDLVDRSVAAYTVRSRLGLSTLTREERRVADQRAAAIARAEEIRQARSGPAPHVAPKRLVVAGAHHGGDAFPAQRSTLSVELLAAALGLAVVVGVVIGIWPRERTRGEVLSATAVPAISSPSSTPSPSPSPASATD